MRNFSFIINIILTYFVIHNINGSMRTYPIIKIVHYFRTQWIDDFTFMRLDKVINYWTWSTVEKHKHCLDKHQTQQQHNIALYNLMLPTTNTNKRHIIQTLFISFSLSDETTENLTPCSTAHATFHFRCWSNATCIHLHIPIPAYACNHKQLMKENYQKLKQFFSS